MALTMFSAMVAFAVMYLPEQRGVSAYGQFVIHYATYNNSADGLWQYGAARFVTSNGAASSSGIPSFNIMWVLFTSVFSMFAVWAASHFMISGKNRWFVFVPMPVSSGFSSVVEEYSGFMVSVPTYISRCVFFTVSSFVLVYALGQDDLLLAILAAFIAFTSVCGFLSNDLHENRSSDAADINVEDVMRVVVPYCSAAALMVVVFLAWNRTGFTTPHSSLSTGFACWCADFMLMVVGAFVNTSPMSTDAMQRVFYVLGTPLHAALSITSMFYLADVFRGKGQT
jgi:hypothetical protein